MEHDFLFDAPQIIGKILSVMHVHDRRVGRTIRTAKRKSDAFIFVLGGRCRLHFADDRELELEQGQLVYLPKGADYSMYILTENYEPIFCNFEFAEENA